MHNVPQGITVLCGRSEMSIKRLLTVAVVVTGGSTWLCTVEGNDVVRGPVQAWQLAAVCVQHCRNITVDWPVQRQLHPLLCGTVQENVL